MARIFDVIEYPSEMKDASTTATFSGDLEQRFPKEKVIDE